MRNHSFSSLSTAVEQDMDHDDDSYDLNMSVSSLAKLNRRKPQISTILKLNLIVVLVISLFIKLTVVSVINGSLSAFICLKLFTHGLILYSFLKKHYISLQLLFVLDVVLFVIFLLFEFLLLVSNFAIIIIQHKRNKNLGFIGIWLMILIAAIDLLILVMVAIVLENYRRPRERLQQLEAKFVTVVHNGRILASQMCKSGSYLLGFVCNASANQTPTNPTTNNGIQNNGTPRIFRDSENPNQRISCIDTQEASSFSLNDEYVHYSSIEMANELGNRFHSFSDFYNFNNRNANQRSNDSNVAIVSTQSITYSNTNTINTITTSFNNNPSNIQTTNVSNILSNISSNHLPTHIPNMSTNATNNELISNSNNTLPSILSSTLAQNLSNLDNFNNLNNLTNSVTETGYPSITTLATSSNLGNLNESRQPNYSNPLSIQTLSEEQSKGLIERTNLFRAMNRNLSFNNPTTSSIMNSNINSRSNSLTNASFSATTNTITNTITNKITNLSNNTNSNQINNLNDKNLSNQENDNIYVSIYQSNVDEDGCPMDGPLRCTTVISNNNNSADDGSTINTIVQMNRNASECLSVNCNPVFI